jgi:hypothetical protein
LLRSVFIGLLLFSTFISYTQGIKQTINYTTKDGLPSNTVYGIAQDNLGYIWVGTDKGLSRFDGKEFINYTEEDGLLDSEILKFFKDTKDRIWYFTLNGNIGYIQNATFHSVSKTGIPERILSITEYKGHIYFTSRTHCFRIEDSGKITSFEWKFHYPSFVSQGDQLFICTSNSIFQYNEGTDSLNLQATTDEFKSTKGYSIFYDDYIISYFGSQSKHDTKVTAYHTVSRKFEQYPIPYEPRNIKVIDNLIYLFTLSGIYTFDPSTGIIKHNQMNHWSTDLVKDSNGNEWISSYYKGFFYKTENQRIIKLIESDKLRSIQHFYGKTILTDDLYHVMNIGPNMFLDTIEIDFTPVTILNTKYDQFVAGGHSIVLLNNKAVKLPAIAMDLVEDQLIIGAIDSIVFFNVRHETIERDFIIKNEQFGKIRELLRRDSSHLVFRNDGGSFIYNLQKKSISNIPIITRINSLHRDQKGLIWIATNGSGTYYLNDDLEAIKIDKTQGLSSNFPDKVVSIGNDIILLYANEIDIIRQFNNNLHDLQIDHVTGIPGALVDISTTDTSLLVVTDKGLYSLDTKSIKNNKTPSTLKIESCTTDDQIISLVDKNNFFLPEGTDRIAIKYSVPFFQYGQQVAFRYRLSTVTDEKSSWNKTSSNSITFEKLKPEKYVFEIQFRSNNSAWSDSQSISFNLQAYWHEQLWFKWFIAFALSIAVILIAQQIRKSVRSRRKLRSEKLFAELSAQKAQFKSHFVFNALNSVRNYLLTNNPQQSDNFLVAYSKLMRKMLDVSNKLIIPLSEELELISLYLQLEQLRLQNQFNFSVINHCLESSSTIKCPAMITQVFVENAVWHGIAPKEGPGSIKIEVFQKNDGYTISIEDDGVGFDLNAIPQKDYSSWGTSIIEDKVRLIKQNYHVDISIDVQSTPNNGTTVIITLPINWQ